MKKYKRLTNNNLEEYNPEYDFCVGCKYFGEPNGCNRPNGTCGNYERFIETYNRLAELEDKIENGTLFSIPFIRKHPKVENAFMVVYDTEHGDLQGQMFCGENAEEEAKKFLEQKLKELKEV